MSRKRRHFTAEQKAQIVRRHLAGKEAVSDLADEFGLQPSLIHNWINQALAQVERAFDRPSGKRRLRSGDWKLIRWFGVAAADPSRYELFNLRDDVGELNDLASAQPKRVSELDKLIDGFLGDTGATYPRPNPAFDAAVP